MHIKSPSHQIEQFEYAHSAAVTTAKSFVLLNSLLFLALNESDAAVNNAWVKRAEIKGVEKTTGEAWAIGQKLYWVAGTSKFSTTAGGNTLAGRAAAAAASGDTTGDIFFNSFEA